MKLRKSRIILFAIAIMYNLLLGLYLKDFLVLSQALTVICFNRFKAHLCIIVYMLSSIPLNR